MEQLLFPITHGTLFFPGMQVLPTFAVYETVRIGVKGMAETAGAWRDRVERLFDNAPIAFRPQNGGAYPDRHVLASHVAPDQAGLTAHIADICRTAAYLGKRCTCALGILSRDPRAVKAEASWRGVRMIPGSPTYRVAWYPAPF